jgi:hypothetical protein
VALATPEFAATLVQRAPDGSLPPQTPELLAKMVPPMFGALQRVLAPLLPDGKLQEPGFVQVGTRALLVLVCFHCEAHLVFSLPSFKLLLQRSAEQHHNTRAPAVMASANATCVLSFGVAGAPLGSSVSCQAFWQPLPKS